MLDHFAQAGGQFPFFREPAVDRRVPSASAGDGPAFKEPGITMTAAYANLWHESLGLPAFDQRPYPLKW
jgi:hypothetical protein